MVFEEGSRRACYIGGWIAHVSGFLALGAAVILEIMAIVFAVKGTGTYPSWDCFLIWLRWSGYSLSSALGGYLSLGAGWLMITGAEEPKAKNEEAIPETDSILDRALAQDEKAGMASAKEETSQISPKPDYPFPAKEKLPLKYNQELYVTSLDAVVPLLWERNGEVCVYTKDQKKVIVKIEDCWTK
jgi:hypothetical protein